MGFDPQPNVEDAFLAAARSGTGDPSAWPTTWRPGTSSPGCCMGTRRRDPDLAVASMYQNGTEGRKKEPKAKACDRLALAL